MEADVRRLVQSIHEAPTMVVLATTGAGGMAVSWCLGVAGASRTLLEARVPYSSRSFADFLGREPDQFVAPETARSLAHASYRRSLALRPDPSTPVAGVACTATIATYRPKRGDHRCHVALWDSSRRVTHSLVLAKGQRDRLGEETVVSRLLLRALAEACDVPHELDLGLRNGERVLTEERRYGDPIAALLDGQVESVLVPAQGPPKADAPFHGVLLSGSFNPLHRGHVRLAEVAARRLGLPAAFELSVVNVDKPQLEEGQVRRRLAQFSGRWTAVVTRAPTFYEKSLLFPGVSFVIGWDTAVRLVDPRYYHHSRAEMLKDLLEMREQGTRFLVAGRAEEGRFHTLSEVEIPRGLEDMFEAIPEDEFREDISSTQLRRMGKGV